MHTHKSGLCVSCANEHLLWALTATMLNNLRVKRNRAEYNRVNLCGYIVPLAHCCCIYIMQWLKCSLYLTITRGSVTEREKHSVELLIKNNWMCWQYLAHLCPGKLCNATVKHSVLMLDWNFKKLVWKCNLCRKCASRMLLLDRGQNKI